MKKMKEKSVGEGEAELLSGKKNLGLGGVAGGINFFLNFHSPLDKDSPPNDP